MDHVATVNREGFALLEAARAAGLDAPVPACTGWDVRKLVQHVAKVHQRTEAIVRTNAMEPPRSSEFPRLADDDALFEQYRDILDRLVETLGNADPAGAAWNFTGRHATVGFWPRRMAHETTIHRVDAEHAAGRTVRDLDDAEAVDGVDELATVMMPNMVAVRESTLRATVHLHATDRTGEWLMSFEDGLLVTTRDHGKGDLAVRGPAAGLFLWAWNRRSPAEANLEVFGDPALLDAWAALVP